MANAARVQNIAKARELLNVPAPECDSEEVDAQTVNTCRCCGGRMIVIETFERGCRPRAPPSEGIDSS